MGPVATANIRVKSLTTGTGQYGFQLPATKGEVGQVLAQGESGEVVWSSNTEAGSLTNTDGNISITNPSIDPSGTSYVVNFSDELNFGSDHNPFPMAGETGQVLTLSGDRLKWGTHTGSGVTSVDISGVKENSVQIVSTGGPITSEGTINLALADPCPVGFYEDEVRFRVGSNGIEMTTAGGGIKIGRDLGMSDVFHLTSGEGSIYTDGPIQTTGQVLAGSLSVSTFENPWTGNLPAGNGYVLTGDTDGCLHWIEDAGTGTVTSVGISSTQLDVGGSPVTTDGTISVDLPSSATFDGNIVTRHGTSNTTLGSSAGLTIGGGTDHSTIIGYNAGSGITSVSNSTLIGSTAGYRCSGSRVTAVGSKAGIVRSAPASEVTGSDLILIGYEAQPSSLSASGEIVIGADTGYTKLNVPSLGIDYNISEADKLKVPGLAISGDFTNPWIHNGPASNGQILSCQTDGTLAWIDDKSGGEVLSVFGRTGHVTAQQYDYLITDISLAGTAAAKAASDSGSATLASVVSTPFAANNVALSSSTTGGIKFLSNGIDGKVLTVSGGAPSWEDSYSGNVTSVFGRMGPVTAQSGDYSIGQITGAGSAAGKSATDAGATYVCTIDSLASVTVNSIPIFNDTLGTVGALAVPGTGESLLMWSATGGYTWGEIPSTLTNYAYQKLSTDTNLQKVVSLAVAPTQAYELAIANSTTGALTFLGMGSNGQVLTMHSGAPAWRTSTAAPVDSVFGRTGTVTADSGDYRADQIAPSTVRDDGVVDTSLIPGAPILWDASNNRYASSGFLNINTLELEVIQVQFTGTTQTMPTDPAAIVVLSKDSTGVVTVNLSALADISATAVSPTQGIIIDAELSTAADIPAHFVPSKSATYGSTVVIQDYTAVTAAEPASCILGLNGANTFRITMQPWSGNSFTNGNTYGIAGLSGTSYEDRSVICGQYYTDMAYSGIWISGAP